MKATVSLQSATGIIEIVSPGPQGIQGEAGDMDIYIAMAAEVAASVDSATAAANDAAGSATAAEASVTTATTQAEISTTKAGEAATSATAAEASATTATTQAEISTTKAGEAATSATDAAASATAASDSAAAAAISAASASLGLGTALQVLRTNAAGDAKEWADPNIDWANPISITGTGITATIGKHHVCSGTTLDYPVTLPAVSGNTGKLISFEMASGLTKLVTLCGNASETIDGALTRIMWAKETCILRCNGSTWTKIAGKSIPMSIKVTGNNIAQTFANGVWTALSLKTVVSGNCPAMHDTVNNRISILRGGEYVVNAYLCMAGGSSAYLGCGISSPTVSAQEENGYSNITNATACTFSTGLTLTTGAWVAGSAYVYSGTLTTQTVVSARPHCHVQEIPKW